MAGVTADSAVRSFEGTFHLRTETSGIQRTGVQEVRQDQQVAESSG